MDLRTPIQIKTAAGVRRVTLRRALEVLHPKFTDDEPRLRRKLARLDELATVFPGAKDAVAIVVECVYDCIADL